MRIPSIPYQDNAKYPLWDMNSSMEVIPFITNMLQNPMH